MALQFSFRITLAIIFILSITFLSQNGYAIMPGWSNTSFNTNDGGVLGGVPTGPIFLTETSIPEGNGTIIARITSDSDPIGFNLTLNEIHPGVYQSTQLALMTSNAIASMSDIIIVRIFDDSSTGIPLNRVVITTDSEGNANPLRPIFTLSSTPNIYEATIKFSSITNQTTNTVKAKEGDIFSVFDFGTGLASHGLVGPNPNVGKGAILVTPEDTVTATIAGDLMPVSFTVNSPPGGGGGGPGGPGGGPSISVVVVDSEPTNEGGGCSDCLPPTLGIDQKYDRIVDNGFSYNGNPVDVELYYTPYPLITVNVGEENLTILKIYDNAGTQNIEHVGLGFGLGKGEFFNDSKATINWDRTFFGAEKVTTYDPENVFDDIRIISKTDKCGTSTTAQCLILNIYHTFREPLDFNMVATYVWDFKRNSWQNYYNHGIEIVGESLNPPEIYDGYHKGHSYILTEIGKITAIDEYENTWHLKKGHWIMDYIPPDRHDTDVPMHGIERTDSRFLLYKEGQELLAEHTLNHHLMNDKDIVNYEFYESDNYFAIPIKIIPRSEDPVLQQNIIHESVNAKELFEKEFGIVHNKYYFYAPVDQQ